MRELLNIKDFDSYVYDMLTEDLIHGEQGVCNRAFINGGPITFADGSSVHPKEIVSAVNKALMYLNSEYSRTFVFAKNTLNIIYLAHSKRIKTMAIDAHMNLYLNAGFVYHVLKMDTELIAAVLMHEVFHALFNHIERGTNWLAAKGKSKTPQTLHDNNLAADIEVNQTLVRIGLIDEERLVNEIKGLYLKNVGGDLGQNTNVVPMEIILNDEKYMEKLRKMCPPPVDPEQAKKDAIKTTDEWNQGYKDAWNKIAGLIKKYGYKKVWDKLMEAGLINGMGEIYTDKGVDDIKALEFITVKSMEDFINESASSQKSTDTGQTYEEGFNTAFRKLVERLNSAMNPQPGGGEGGQGGGQNYDTDLKNDDLDEIELPGDDNEEGDDGSNGLPENIKSDNSGKGKGKNDDDNQEGQGGDDNDGETGDDDKESKEDKKSSSQQHGKGGKGKSTEKLTDKDVNKLADDLEKSGGDSREISDPEISQGSESSSGNDSESQSSNGSEKDPSVGGTGSFIENGLSNDELKEAGYSQEEIDDINEIRKQNETNNSKAKIQQAIDKMRRDLPKSDPINKYLKSIEIESNKYKNIWKDILEDFLSQKTRRAGKDTPTGYNDWKRKSRIAMGEYGVHHRDESQDPQDVNIYVDVSGSVDVKLLEVICKSLVVFTQQWEYSGMNICPWASRNNGVFKVEEFYDKNEREITEEILSIVSTGIAQCGGGTEARAAISAMLDVVEQTLNDPNKDEKDDVHIVITDGFFDYEDIEDKIKSAIMHTVHRADVAAKAPENTIWMIYDAPDDWKERWTKEIKKGKLVFITSEVVKNNG